jgi:hypothetical protein
MSDHPFTFGDPLVHNVYNQVRRPGSEVAPKAIFPCSLRRRGRAGGARPASPCYGFADGAVRLAAYSGTGPSGWCPQASDCTTSRQSRNGAGIHQEPADANRAANRRWGKADPEPLPTETGLLQWLFLQS